MRLTIKVTELPEPYMKIDYYPFAIAISKNHFPEERETLWPRGSWRDMYIIQPACKVPVHCHPLGEVCHVEPGVYALGELADLQGQRQGLAKDDI